MRVLHLPVNIASIPSHTVRGLSQIGVEARGLILGNKPIQSPEGLKVIEPVSRHKVHRWAWTTLRKIYLFLRWVAWADIVHWHFGAPVLPWGLDLKYIKAINKPGIVEWHGSDIRIPEIDFVDNPYYEKAFHSGYEYRHIESLQHSRQLQKRFAEAGFAAMTPWRPLLRYIQSDIFPRCYVVPARILLSDYHPIYPDANTARPIVAHAPSAPIAKGTPTVLKVVEQLQSRLDFEFRLIEGMPRREALKRIQSSDIFLEQFIIGYHGMAALEAMAMGKPVVCYIMPSVVDTFPPDCPIVNASLDTLADTLEELLRDGRLRHEIGRRSRVYIEKYHDGVKLAYRLVEIYREVIESKKT